MTTPQEPAPDTETEEGDTTPAPDHLPRGPQETNPEADDSED